MKKFLAMALIGAVLVAGTVVAASASSADPNCEIGASECASGSIN